MTAVGTGRREPGLTRRLVMLAVSVVVAVALAAFGVRAAWPDDGGPDGTTVGGPTERADCDPVGSQPATENRHVGDQRLTYPAPPSFGDHSERWAVLSRSFYTVADRPDVSVLVHNLEHGYNILWYDQSVADDPARLAQVEAIAAGYTGSGRNPGNAFIAAPWTAKDGGGMPAGVHYALTHWYADPDDATGSRSDEVGYTRYCREVSDDLVRRWMLDFPLQNAPEGYRVNM